MSIVLLLILEASLTLFVPLAAAEVIYTEDDKIDYEKTTCVEGLEVFLEEINEDYDEWMEAHWSNPEFTSVLGQPAKQTFDTYRQMLHAERKKYKARKGQTFASQVEERNRCHSMINYEVSQRRKLFLSNYRSRSKDYSSTAVATRWETINGRFEDEIHFPMTQILGRTHSFADGLPCYLNKCVK